MLWGMVKKKKKKTSLVTQWLRLCAPNSGDTGLIFDQGTKIPHATRHDKNKYNKIYLLNL